MTPEEVRGILEAAARIEPAAGLALRIAAVTGAQRGEIAALQWADLDGCQLTIDSCIVVQRDRDHDGNEQLIDASIKPVSDRTVCLDQTTVRMIEQQQPADEGGESYIFSTESGPPHPDRIGDWWQRARELAGVRGSQHFDELHSSFGAAVVNVLEFGEPAVDIEPEPAVVVDAPVARVRVGRRVGPRLWKLWLSMLDLSEPKRDADADGSQVVAGTDDTVLESRPRAPIPASFELAAALLLTVFVLVHVF